ncbi:MAG: 4'-phosphopantetheinyl transferase superfamily protein [Bacteroidota bacterium]
MPIISLQNITNEVLLGIWQVTETKAELEEILSQNFHDTSKPVNPAESVGLHWFASRVLVQHLFSSHKIEIHKDIHNKPTLYIDGEKYFISISHSHLYVGVMVCKTHEIGLDIEQIDDRINRVAHKFMNESEKQFGHTIEHKTLIWSAKEAVYKWYGKRELDFRGNMEVQPFVVNNTGTFNCKLHKNETQQVLPVHYYQLDNYFIAYCF